MPAACWRVGWTGDARAPNEYVAPPADGQLQVATACSTVCAAPVRGRVGDVHGVLDLLDFPKQFVTLSGFKISFSRGAGVYMPSAASITLADLTVTNHGQNAIVIGNSTHAWSNLVIACAVLRKLVLDCKLVMPLFPCPLIEMRAMGTQRGQITSSWVSLLVKRVARPSRSVAATLPRSRQVRECVVSAWLTGVACGLGVCRRPWT